MQVLLGECACVERACVCASLGQARRSAHFFPGVLTFDFLCAILYIEEVCLHYYVTLYVKRVTFFAGGAYFFISFLQNIMNKL